MKTDLFTKALLTVIAVMLSVIAAKQLTQPAAVVHADAPVLQFSAGANGKLMFYNPVTAKIYVYDATGSQQSPISLH